MPKQRVAMELELPDDRPCTLTYAWAARPQAAPHAPNPAYPRGSFVDVGVFAERSCLVELPYPAAGDGIHMLRCSSCGADVRAFAHGTADDPTHLKFACQGRAA